MTPDERENLLTLLPRVSTALQHLFETLAHGEAPTDLRETTIVGLRALVAALSPECLGPEAVGGRCQARGVIWDHARGGRVCIEHLPIDAATPISNMIIAGRQEGRITVEGRVYSWRED